MQQVIETLEEQVQRGVELLDREQPGWHERVYVPDLDMRSGPCSILGQVYRDVYDRGFVDAVEHLFGIQWSREVPDHDYQKLVDHGFAMHLEWPQLETAWAVLIQQRMQVRNVCPNDHENAPFVVKCKECGESLREEENW